ncbi:hypothetical protein ACHHYP_20325 [Achlya hypogyna]|uniref:Uncharacterized protein n=1 Tax=Achlya hypogyna TaxID=1202772 RepID=A0A1V9ZM31_ACHHY|nr:hypothetical protein ACHHYP_20325 [Achlya hypogyna]
MPNAKIEVAVAAALALTGAFTWKKQLHFVYCRQENMPSAKVEIVVASLLGVAGGLVWKRYANAELNKFDAYYAHLKKQNN